MDPFVLLDDALSGDATLLTGLARVDQVTLADLDDTLASGWLDGLHCFAWLPYDLGEAELRVGDGASGALYWFRERTPGAQPPPATGQGWVADLGPSSTEAEFTAAVERIQAAIAAGSTYQINHTHRLVGRLLGDPRGLYSALRARQPVAFGVLAHLPGPAASWTLSLSPELFLSVDGEVATARPMKGTAPADTDPEALREGPKNRAENLMIVDLLRNDLSRVAVPGTVEVPSLFDVERVGALWQMTSTVTARLRPGTTPAHLLRATFPCGSITGAPKLSSMRIIRGLEPDRRGIYTGSLGTITPMPAPPGWSMTLSVAIRTLEIDDEGTVRLGIGSGIVADSTAAGEWSEGLDKARFVTDHRPTLRVKETMAVVDGACRLADAHRARLAASLRALGFAPAPHAVDEAVAAAGPGAWRVALEVDADGGSHVARARLEPTPEPVTALLAPTPWTVGPLSRHKTSERAHLDEAVAAATGKGAFDTIGHDERGRVLEGGRSNVFARIGGRWLTPASRLGILPGIQRAELLADPGLIGAETIDEAEFTVEDLRTADRVVLTNALRGPLVARVEDLA